MNTKSTIGELVIYVKTLNIKSNEHQVNLISSQQ